MAGLPDLIERSQPAYFGGGVNAAGATRGDWSWTFVDVLDRDGAPITVTDGTCRIESDGSLIQELDFAGGVGEFTVSLDDAATSTLTPGGYQWSLLITDGAADVWVWLPGNSDFTIRAGGVA